MGKFGEKDFFYPYPGLGRDLQGYLASPCLVKESQPSGAVGRGTGSALDGSHWMWDHKIPRFRFGRTLQLIPFHLPLGLLQPLAWDTPRNGNSGAIQLLREFFWGNWCYFGTFEEEIWHGSFFSITGTSCHVCQPGSWGCFRAGLGDSGTTFQGLCSAWDYNRNSPGLWAPFPVLESRQAGHRSSLQGLEEPSVQ